jgi:DNA polymerase-3 subunit alpha
LALNRLVSQTNKRESYYYRPRISYEELPDFVGNGNIVSFSGHYGSTIGDHILDPATGIVHNDWKLRAVPRAKYLQDVFGKGNFMLEVQTFLIGEEHKRLTECVRELSRLTGIPTIATTDAHFAFPNQWELQKVLICLQVNQQQPGKKIVDIIKETRSQNANKPWYTTFFAQKNLYIPSYDELLKWGNTPEELENTIRLMDGATEINIAKNPTFAHVKCPEGMTEFDYLSQLCREGWDRMIKPLCENNLPLYYEYAERINRELKVINETNLAGYFLIVWDIIQFCQRSNIYIGVARGSAGGCLISYLMGLIKINPVARGLIFERFYNEGRNSADRIAIPDFDLDIQASGRDAVINYIKSKYGEDCVAQMVTFTTIKGRSALKDVARVYGIPESEANRMTEPLRDETKIGDELKEMEEEFGTSSLIFNDVSRNPQAFSEWVHIENGEFRGQYANIFRLASQLEGVYRGTGKHAAGVIISDQPLEQSVPMIKQGNAIIAGHDMKNLEKQGLVKFDILGVTVLDCIKSVVEHARTGLFEIYNGENIEVTEEQ